MAQVIQLAKPEGASSAVGALAYTFDFDVSANEEVIILTDISSLAYWVNVQLPLWVAGAPIDDVIGHKDDLVRKWQTIVDAIRRKKIPRVRLLIVENPLADEADIAEDLLMCAKEHAERANLQTEAALALIRMSREENGGTQ